MKIKDICESAHEEFNEKLKRYILDVLVLYKTNGANVTSINNVINELSKDKINVSSDDLKKIVDELGYSISGEKIILSNSEDDSEYDDLQTGEEYDPVETMAKNSIDKDLK